MNPNISMLELNSRPSTYGDGPRYREMQVQFPKRHLTRNGVNKSPNLKKKCVRIEISKGAVKQDFET